MARKLAEERNLPTSDVSHDAIVSEIGDNCLRMRGREYMPENESWYRALLDAITRIQSQMLGSIRRNPLFEDLLATL